MNLNKKHIIIGIVLIIVIILFYIYFYIRDTYKLDLPRNSDGSYDIKSMTLMQRFMLSKLQNKQR